MFYKHILSLFKKRAIR